jgi:HPt (histidine-containing phosphotransfer) domain-containing protein
MSSSPRQEPRVDPQALQRLRRLAGDDVARKVVEAFLQNAPERGRRARESIERGDADGVREALHSLVSSAGQLGGIELERLCEKGLRQARDGEPGLDVTVRQVLHALDGFMAGLRVRLEETWG